MCRLTLNTVGLGQYTHSTVHSAICVEPNVALRLGPANDAYLLAFVRANDFRTAKKLINLNRVVLAGSEIKNTFKASWCACSYTFCLNVTYQITVVWGHMLLCLMIPRFIWHTYAKNLHFRNAQWRDPKRRRDLPSKNRISQKNGKIEVCIMAPACILKLVWVLMGPYKTVNHKNYTKKKT